MNPEKIRFAELLEEIKLNPNQLAEILGVSSTYLYDVLNENKPNSISKKLAEKINKYFPYISASYLLTGEGSLIIESGNISEGRLEKALEIISQSILNNSIANKENSTANKDRAKADLINAEANLVNAKANLASAEAFNKISNNMERVIDLLEKKNIDNKE